VTPWRWPSKVRTVSPVSRFHRRTVAVAGAGERAAGVHHGESRDPVLVPFEGAKGAAGAQAPQAKGLVASAGEDLAPADQGQGRDAGGVAFEGAQGLAGLQVPDAHGGAVGGDGEEAVDRHRRLAPRPGGRAGVPRRS